MQDMLYFDMLAKVQIPCMTYETFLTVYAGWFEGSRLL